MICVPRDHSPPLRRQGRALLLFPDQEHEAVLEEVGKPDQLRRKDDLLDEGVSAVFGIRLGEAGLHALRFDAGRFTAEQARTWLRDRGLEARLFRAADGASG
jgi:hypothetical protein